MTDKPLVHIVDDEDSVRQSTSFALKIQGYACRTWASGVEFLKEARHLEPGCVLLDVRMPEMDGLEVQQQMNERGLLLPVIVLTGHGDVSLAVQAMKAGAVDFLEKPFEAEVLMGALKRAFERLASAGRATASAHDAHVMLASLSSRERDVLEGLAQGYPNKTIAYDLGISSRTVEVYRANIMTKLNARSLSDALRIAFAAGLGANR